MDFVHIVVTYLSHVVDPTDFRLSDNILDYFFQNGQEIFVGKEPKDLDFAHDTLSIYIVTSLSPLFFINTSLIINSHGYTKTR